MIYGRSIYAGQGGGQGLNAGVYVADVVVLLNADPPVIAERLRQRGAHSRFERQPGGSRHVSYPKPDHGDYGVMIISRVQARSVDFGDRVGYLVSRAAAVTLPAPHGPIQVIGAYASSVISTSSNPITNGATSSSHHSNTTSTG